MIFEARVIDGGAKTFEADFALADVRVSVDLRGEIGFGIVQVERDDLVETDQRIELAHSLVPAFGCAYVVTGGEKVGRVEADGEAFHVANAFKNGGEMLESIAEATSLAGGVFERDPDFGSASDREYFVETANDLLDAFSFASAEMGARVHDNERQAERVSKFDFLHQRLQGLSAIVRISRSEVDQVSRMSENAVE